MSANKGPLLEGGSPAGASQQPPVVVQAHQPQEHRVIKRKWIANNSQVLSAPIMPVGTMAVQMTTMSNNAVANYSPNPVNSFG
jgi:hypothetical protein